MRVIPLRQGNVRQGELDAIAAIDIQIRSLTGIRNRLAADILSRLIEGEPVEPGTHTAELRRSDRSVTQTVRLALDGRTLR